MIEDTPEVWTQRERLRAAMWSLNRTPCYRMLTRRAIKREIRSTLSVLRSNR